MLGFKQFAIQTQRKKDSSEMAPQLPRVFALKLSSNDKYLACVNEDNEAQNLLKFQAEDIIDLSAVYEWEPAESGGADLGHVKCPARNKYWVRRESDHSLWIAVEADKPVEDKSSWECTLFQVLFSGADGSKINLKQVELDYYVVAWPGDEPFNLCLYADGPNRGGLDTFSVIELVPVSTEISDVKFRLADAKINNSTTANIVESTLVNNSDEVSHETGELQFSVVESSTWKLVSSSLTSGLTLTINSAIPTIVDDGKVELSGEEVTGLKLDSGKPWEKTVTDSIAYRVAIPPKGNVVVTLKATHASADIPFSYTESITFADGRVITRHVHDGIFTRVNYYDFKVIKN